MDRSWIHCTDRLSTDYVTGVAQFLQFAKIHLGDQASIPCPCKFCQNVLWQEWSNVDLHLSTFGFSASYTMWSFHGEENGYATTCMEDSNGNDEDDQMLQMIEDVHRGALADFGTPDQNPEHMESNDVAYDDGPQKFDELLKNVEQPVFPGCKASFLSILVKLLHTKVLYRWSNNSFTTLLQILNDFLPEGHLMPSSYYDAKKLLRELGLGWDPIHACRNDCVLFRKELKDKDKCPECNESRWKHTEGTGKKVPQKVLRHFPLTPRLRRLFLSRKTASDMRWHKEKLIPEDNMLRHPADAIAWRNFDETYPFFAQDPRNVRIGLASDGFNPFGDKSTSYSMWPVVLMPYNLPPWKCMKDPFFMTSLLIPGPRAPGKDIDVYLQPLIDELKELWENGVQAYDAVTNSIFRLHASVLWTINDFPAYGDLSGWSTKGYLACPICNSDASSVRLRSKIGYVGHRRFLPTNHHWRNNLNFNGEVDNRQPPHELTGDDILAQQERLPEIKFGKVKNRRRGVEELNWTKRSIFFQLPYWKNLKIRHNLDVMHIEKNICDNILGTLLNIEGKSKDTDKARMDLKDWNIRSELHLRQEGDRLVKPAACYNLLPNERKGFCEFLKSVKFPDGYAANISRCVNTKDGKVYGLKSHDCHVLLQRMLPIGMRGYLEDNVLNVLTELGSFFRELCSRVLRVDILEKLRDKIVIILCKLEMIFPPAFFDSMVHLAVHLPHEAMLGGPVHYRWMYPIERYIGSLKGVVRNKARPEGSVAEAYIANECLTFCSLYVCGIETRFNREDRNKGAEVPNKSISVFSYEVRPLGRTIVNLLSDEDYNLTTWFVLNNCDEARPYLIEHENILLMESRNNIEMRQRKRFPSWFRDRITRLHARKQTKVSDELYSLAMGPDKRAKSDEGCIVNGVKYLTVGREKRRLTQNSGLCVEGEHKGETVDFYGRLNEVIELEYMQKCKVYLFRCEWFDLEHKKPIKIDDEFTSINITKCWYKSDPFIFAGQAIQVFYLPDTKLGKNWNIVQKCQHRHAFHPSLFGPDDDDDSNVGGRADGHQQEECSYVHAADESREITTLVRYEVSIELITDDEVGDGDDEDD